MFNQIIEILSAHATGFNPLVHLIPSNLMKKIHRFYNYTFPYAMLLITNQDEIKNKLFKLSKKASEDAKKEYKYLIKIKYK